MKIWRNFFLQLGILISIGSKSQIDSISKPDFRRLTKLYFSDKENHLAEDTLLDEHYNYFPKDYNGNLALPSQEILLENKAPDPLGFRFFKTNYRNHLLHESDILFHSNKKPYTRVFGLAGAREEQILKLLHTNNIRRLNYTLIFNRYKSIGFYKSQLAAVENFVSTVSYKSKNEKYSINLWFLFNKIRHQENGGLKNPADFDSLYTRNKELLIVNLQSAKRVTANNISGFSQAFRLNKNADSSRISHLLLHKIQYNKDYFVFNDDNPLSGFFPLILHDSIRTKDSSFIYKIINSAGYLIRDKNSGWEANFNFIHEITKISQTFSLGGTESKLYFDSLYLNHLLTVGLSRIKEDISTHLEASYVLKGSNKNNYSVQLNHAQNFKFLRSKFEFNLNHEKRNADRFYQYYLANNHQWSMNFNPVITTQTNLLISVLSGKFYFSNQTRLIDNYIWFSTLETPVQSLNTALITRSTIGGKLNFGSFRWDNRLNHQYTTRDDIISIAPFFLQSILFYDGILFSGNLHLQAGFQLNYYSSFNSNIYIPSINSYYTSARREAGNYPFIDFFINAEIKPVRFFILIDHANQGLNGSGYQLSAGYPMPDRSFKFGFTWLFWD